MVKNTCRPIVLYNKLIPAQKEKLECDYIAIGEYDGISIGENILSEGQREEDGFLELWERIIKESCGLKGVSTSRIIFGFRSEDVCGGVDQVEEEFLSAKGLPFLFISMLQFKEYQIDLLKLRRIVEQGVNEQNRDARAVCYLVLDNMDILLLIRAKKYDIGAAVINKFHRKESISKDDGGRSLTLNYSYTVFGFASWLAQDGVDLEAYDAPIQEVCFDAIEHSPGSAKKLKDELEHRIAPKKNGRRIRMLEVMGHDDVEIVWKNASWEKLIPLYAEGQRGLLTNENKVFRDSVYSVVTRIKNVSLKDENTYFAGAGEAREAFGRRIESGITGMCQAVRERVLYRIPEGIWNRCRIDDANVKARLTYDNAILQILNSLQKFEDTEFSKYVFTSIYEAFKMFISVIYNDEAEIDIGKGEAGLEFLNAINLLIENESGVDRNFFQTPDFNAVMFNSPVKLNAFYTAYTYYVTECLNEFRKSTGEDDRKNSYKFLICPWMGNQIQSEIIFDGGKSRNRLVLVKVTERLLFNPRLLLFNLTHEIAHFVGASIRSREKRLRILEKMTVGGILNYWERESALKKYISMEGLRECRILLEKEISLEREAIWSGWKTEEDQEAFRYRYHFLYVFGMMNECVYNVLVRCSEKLCGIWKKHYFTENYEMGRELQLRILELENSWNSEMRTLLGYKRQIITKRIRAAMDMLSETVADLAGVLLLKARPEVYYKTFADTFDRPSETSLVIRSGLVAHTMVRRKNEQGYEYRNVWPENLTRKTEQAGLKASSRDMITLAEYVIDNIDHSKKTYLDMVTKKKQMEDEPMLIFNDTRVWKSALEYLLECKRLFEMYENNSEVKPLRDIVLKAYRLKSGEEEYNVEQSVMIMEETVEQYMTHIYGETETDGGING